MKLKHLLLFILACAVLIVSELTAGSLIALAMLFQLALLMNSIALTKKSQIAALKIFLICLPTFFFWGGIHSFVQIYFAEQQWLYFVMAFVITLALSLIVTLQGVLVFKFLEGTQFTVGPALQQLFNDIKNSKNLLFRATGLIFILSFIPWLETDWKLIFSVMVTHLYLNWSRLKPALGRLS